MTGNERVLLASRAQATKYGNLPFAEICAAICHRADSDGPGVEISTLFGYPLFQYVASALNLPYRTNHLPTCTLAINKNIIHDLQIARELAASIDKEADTRKVFPEWESDDIYTVLRLQNVEAKDLYLKKIPSVVIEIKFKPNFDIGKATVFAAIPPVDLPEGDSFGPNKRTMDKELVRSVLALINSHLDSPERSRDR